MKTAFVIPAYNPDKRLVFLCEELQKIEDTAVIVVDDGSRSDCSALFRELEIKSGCVVAHHPLNLGKGRALKTGIRLAIRKFPGLLGVVTADADGQHLPEDIVSVSDALINRPNSIILGVRDFSSADVPFKSRWGNRITSLIFRLGTGIRCTDTQTGLRGIPSRLLDFCLSIPGSRYEYEMNVLTMAAKDGIAFVMMPIKTVYLEKNSSSHFHAVRDSARIYYNILKFGISSLVCAVFDLSVFTALTYFLGRTSSGILAATITARCLSGALNFTLNKRWCFTSRGDSLRQAAGYFVLFLAQMFTSWACVTLLSSLPINLTMIKLIVDSSLFMLSYNIQRRLIFRDNSCRNRNSSDKHSNCR